MKEAELVKLGFKKKKQDTEYWFELRYHRHLFITNDTIYNKGSDVWHIGYETKGMMDIFWFNNQLTNPKDFKTIFRVLTGKDIL